MICFLGPSVHRDDATAGAVEAAVSAGKNLALDIRADLENIAATIKSDTPLSVIKGGGNVTEPGVVLSRFRSGYLIANLAIKESDHRTTIR